MTAASGSDSKTFAEPVLKGLIQDVPLMISSLIEYASKQHAAVEIVTRTVEDPNVYHRTNYGAVYHRIKRLSNVLRDRLGVKPGDRIATLAWNTVRHFELFYAVSGIGAVLHTLNPRLYTEQLTYIINHADDSIIFLDITLIKLLDQLRPHIKCKRFVLMTDDGYMPASCKPLGLAFPNCPSSGPLRALCYEHLLRNDKGSTDWAWPVFDERTASSLCYTSGTTGNPKGVLYAHRSNVIHSMMACTRDGLGLSVHDSILLIVPMFHANAWGIPYAAAMCGAKLCFPGEHLGGADIYNQLVAERITYSCGVPTVWLAVFAHIDSLLAADKSKSLSFPNSTRTRLLPDLQRVGIGGSSCPPAMMKRFYSEFANPIHTLHLWGMTELSPLGSVANLLPKHLRSAADPSKPSTIDEKISVMSKQGRFIYGVEAAILDDQNRSLPWNGTSFGNLVVRGPWIASAYYNDEKASKSLMTTLDGDNNNGTGSGPQFMVTGDVATIDSDGFMQITDRSKDVIKSGGEWISSIDLENAAVGHPSIQEAAVIGVAHPKWQERPLLVVVRKAGAQHSQVSKSDVLKFLESKVVRWWLPDDVVFVDALPHTATGKLLKTKLREQFKDHKLPEVVHLRSAL